MMSQEVRGLRCEGLTIRKTSWPILFDGEPKAIVLLLLAESSSSLAVSSEGTHAWKENSGAASPASRLSCAGSTAGQLRPPSTHRCIAAAQRWKQWQRCRLMQARTLVTIVECTHCGRFAVPWPPRYPA